MQKTSPQPSFAVGDGGVSGPRKCVEKSVDYDNSANPSVEKVKCVEADAEKGYQKVVPSGKQHERRDEDSR